MELDKIQLQTTWNDAAGSINQNFEKLRQAILSMVNESGGIDEAQLEQYLRDNGYTTEDWVLAKKYITEAALEGYATESWVRAQGFIKGVTSGDGFVNVEGNAISLNVDEQGGLGATKQGLGIVEIPQSLLDAQMSSTSANAVQNKTIKKYVDDAIANIDIPEGGIKVESDPIFKASPAAKITDADITKWNSKQDEITIDSAMSDTSANPVQNKVIKEYVDLHPRYETIEEIVPPEEVEDFATKQWVRDSFTEPSDFKTINGQSIVGEGDIEMNGGKVTLDTEMSDESENGVQNKVIKAYVDGKVDTINTAELINVTYEELLDKCLRGQLIAGARYRIIDYYTTTVQEGTKSNGADGQFDIVVTALDNWLPSEEAFAIEALQPIRGSVPFLGWVEGWKLRYTLAPFVRTRFEWVAMGNEYIVNDIADDGLILNRVSFHNVSPSYTEEIDGRQYYVFVAQVAGWTISAFSESPDPQAGDALYLYYNSLEAITIQEVIPHERGKGCIYEMTDEWGNSAPYDFKNIRFRVYRNGSVLSFEQSEGSYEVWAYTFFGGDDEELSAVGKVDLSAKNEEGITTRLYYDVHNNKVKYFPTRLKPLVCYVYHYVIDTETLAFTLSTKFHDNEFINCENVTSAANSNQYLRNCKNVTIRKNGENMSNIHIDRLAGTSDNPIVIEGLTTSDDYTTYIGKNSQGEVKIWNPADLV